MRKYGGHGESEPSCGHRSHPEGCGCGRDRMGYGGGMGFNGGDTPRMSGGRSRGAPRMSDSDDFGGGGDFGLSGGGRRAPQRDEDSLSMGMGEGLAMGLGAAIGADVITDLL